MIVFSTGCNIKTHPSNPTSDVCMFDIVVTSRPSSKSAAMSGSVIGNSVLGGAGATVLPQLGLLMMRFLYVYFVV
jgi:hypothetical protein